ncbi:MAG: hypothetical protein J3K34DRAFT_404963, partial [Monoraphidium minutum]
FLLLSKATIVSTGRAHGGAPTVRAFLVSTVPRSRQRGSQRPPRGGGPQERAGPRTRAGRAAANSQQENWTQVMRKTSTTIDAVEDNCGEAFYVRARVCWAWRGGRLHVGWPRAGAGMRLHACGAGRACRARGGPGSRGLGVWGGGAEARCNGAGLTQVGAQMCMHSRVLWRYLGSPQAAGRRGRLKRVTRRAPMDCGARVPPWRRPARGRQAGGAGGPAVVIGPAWPAVVIGAGGPAVMIGA